MSNEQNKKELSSARPVRRIGRGHRSMRGTAIIKKRPVEFESSLEHDFLTLMDFDDNVLAVTAQPSRISYLDSSGRRRHYIPDFLVEIIPSKAGDTNGLLCEVKYRSELKAKWRSLKPKFKAGKDYAAQRNLRFVIMTEVEIRNVVLDNARLLKQYKSMRYNPGIEEKLAATLASIGEATPKILLQAAFNSSEARDRSLASLMRMIAIHRVHTLPTQKLTMNSPIWITVGEGFQCDPHSFRQEPV